MSPRSAGAGRLVAAPVRAQRHAVDAEGSIAFSAQDLFFREWSERDVALMTQLFDTDEMNRWTPLPSPFTVAVARDYVLRAREAQRRDGTLQLAICLSPDGLPVGEVIVFPAGEPHTVELAYAVSANHRGCRIGARAVQAALDLARLAGARRAVLTIADDNAPSQDTAEAAGFVRTGAPLQRRERKGFVLQMETWERSL